VNKINSETEKSMVKMYRKGYTMAKIANKYSVSPASVYLHLRKFIPKEERQIRRRIPSVNEEQQKKICALYKNGMSSVEIGRKYSISADLALYFLKKYGVDTSKGGKYNPKVDAEKLYEMKKTYRETQSILETAKMMGLHPSTVHYQLTKEGIVKRKVLNQKTVKLKYDKITNVLKELFMKMNLELEHVQEKYNGSGPDMIIRDGEKRIVVEHKATVKRSWYWKHGIEEALDNSKKMNISDCWVVTTAKKPPSFEEHEKVRLIFYDEFRMLLIENDLEHLVPEIEFISNTPSV